MKEQLNQMIKFSKPILKTIKDSHHMPLDVIVKANFFLKDQMFLIHIYINSLKIQLIYNQCGGQPVNFKDYSIGRSIDQDY